MYHKMIKINDPEFYLGDGSQNGIAKRREPKLGKLLQNSDEIKYDKSAFLIHVKWKICSYW